MRRIAGVGESAGKDHELIASQPRQRIAAGDARLEPAGDQAQKIVAGFVADGVVDVLEAIEIEEHHGNVTGICRIAAFARILRQAQGFAETFHQQCAIRQTGQGIVRCHVLQSLLRILDGADVGKRNQDRTRLGFAGPANRQYVFRDPHDFTRQHLDGEHQAKERLPGCEHLLRRQCICSDGFAVLGHDALEIGTAPDADQPSRISPQDPLGARIAGKDDAVARLQDDALVQGIHHRAVAIFTFFQAALDLFFLERDADQSGDVVHEGEIVGHWRTWFAIVDAEHAEYRARSIVNQRRPAGAKAECARRLAIFIPARIGFDIGSDDLLARVDGGTARACGRTDRLP